MNMRRVYTVAMRTERVGSLLNDDGLAERIRQTVLPEEGRIPMFIYTDPGVYEAELSRVYGKSWLFVAHVSELIAA